MDASFLRNLPPQALNALLLQFAAASTSQASPPLPPPTTIQPKLEIAGEINALKRRLDALDDELKRIERSRDDPDEDGTLGDVDQSSPRRKKTKKSRQQKVPKKYLGGPVENLSPAEKNVRRQLAGFVKEKIISIAGDITYYLPKPRQAPEPSGDSNDRDDDDDTVTPPKFLFNFDSHVIDARNLRILQQAAGMVTKEQSPTAETCQLTYKTVKWTYDDVLDLCKSRFRTWRLSYGRHKDTAKAAKREQQNIKNKRAQRKKHLKSNRMKAVKAYKKEHGRDPTSFLQTDWMSSEVSEIDTDDEQAKTDHRTRLANEARLSAIDLKEGTPVWEVIKPVWRSEVIEKVYMDLDTLYREQRRKTNKNGLRPLTKRVNLGRKSPKDRKPWPLIYPCMLNMGWYAEYLNGMADEGMLTCQADPEGWKAPEGEQHEDQATVTVT